jgi:hypothetical protein
VGVVVYRYDAEQIHPHSRTIAGITWLLPVLAVLCA